MSAMTDIPITVRGDVDARAVEQLRRCAEAGDAVAAVLCADGHVGYSQPIGGAVAYPDHISPSGVGYDIACGNKAVRTDVLVDDVRDDVPRIMDEVFSRISFGVGRNNTEPVDHPVLDAIAKTKFRPQRRMAQMARNQLGTVGAGNHYVDLFAGDDGFVWVGVHFGSRGFGHKTASGFLALAAGRQFTDRIADGEMDSPPVLLHADSELGRDYIAAMELAGEYAYAGRDVVVDKVLEILGGHSTYEVHNHHNFAWRERHLGVDAWVYARAAPRPSPAKRGSSARRWVSRR
jgi:tRNA-splicing ligase RtcB